MTERYASIVFQQGDDAQETLDIIDQHGEQAGLDHLAQWDFGQESIDAASVYDSIYTESEIMDVGDRQYRSLPYVMAYSYAYGYVGLARKLQDDETTSW